MKNVALATVNQYCKAVLVWNLMLDNKMGPNLMVDARPAMVLLISIRMATTS